MANKSPPLAHDYTMSASTFYDENKHYTTFNELNKHNEQESISKYIENCNNFFTISKPQAEIADMLIR